MHLGCTRVLVHPVFRRVSISFPLIQTVLVHSGGAVVVTILHLASSSFTWQFILTWPFFPLRKVSIIACVVYLGGPSLLHGSGGCSVFHLGSSFQNSLLFSFLGVSFWYCSFSFCIQEFPTCLTIASVRSPNDWHFKFRICNSSQLDSFAVASSISMISQSDILLVSNQW